MRQLKHLVKQKVTVDKDSTVIVEGAGNPEAISPCCSYQVSNRNTTSEFDREKLQERLAKLSGGWRLLRSEPQLKLS